MKNSCDELPAMNCRSEFQLIAIFDELKKVNKNVEKFTKFRI